MTKRILPALTLGASMLLSVSAAQAQSMAFANLGLVNGLPSLLGTLSSSGGQSLGPLTGGMYALNSVLPALNDLTVLVPTSLGGTEIIFGFVPSAEILLTNPVGILQFVSDGGSILSSTLGPVPAIPLISQPLTLGELGGLGDFGLPGLDSLALPANILPLDLLNPTSIIDQVLGIVSGLASAVPPL